MFKRLIFRFVRNSLSTAITAWWTIKQNDPRYIVLQPVIASVGKYLREKFPKASPFIPF